MSHVRNELPYMQLKERYAKITWDGRSCITELLELPTMIEGFEDEDSKPVVTDVWLTRDEFENLSEFVGW
jgi:hypothetical protein